MGRLTELVEGAITRNIIPMGKPEVKENYPKKAKFKDVVRDQNMNPQNVDIIADGEDVDPDEELGDVKDVTIMPKQRGGGTLGIINSLNVEEEVCAVVMGFCVDPEFEDNELWDKIRKRVLG